MNEIKIGSVIQPSTPLKKQELGTGIVFETNGYGRTPICVIFFTEQGATIIRNFRHGEIELAKAEPEEQRRLVNASYNYRKLMMELKSA